MSAVLLDTDLPAEPLPQDITILYDRASHVTVRAYKPGSRPIHSDLTSIIINGARYADKVAGCDCAELELFKFSDEGYTRCAKHGILAIGTLRREMVNGMARSTSHGRR
jgi:hypothetical protein